MDPSLASKYHRVAQAPHADAGQLGPSSRIRFSETYSARPPWITVKTSGNRVIHDAVMGSQASIASGDAGDVPDLDGPHGAHADPRSIDLKARSP